MGRLNGSGFSIATDGTGEVFEILESGNVGIGTTSPLTKLSVQGTAGEPIFNFASSTGASLMYLDAQGRLGIGTVNPNSAVDLYSATADSILTVSAFGASNTPMIAYRAGTSSLSTYFTMGVDAEDDYKFKIYSGSSIENTSEFMIDSNGLTSIANLEMGEQAFPDNAGIVSWMDMAVTSAQSVAGTVDSYTAQIDGNALLTVYAESDGVGGIQNSQIIIGTSSPLARLYVWSSGIGAGNAFTVANGASSTLLTVKDNGNIGIGSSTPSSRLDIYENTASLKNMLTIATSTAGYIFRVNSYGQTFGDIAYQVGADYAEYFYTNDIDLAGGETVCIDQINKSAVERCIRSGDNNIMGIISTHPSIVGNNQKSFENNPHYKIVAMLGQIPAKVNNENGNVLIGDELTSAFVPGELRKANPGESTVGVALENTQIQITDNANTQITDSTSSKSQIPNPKSQILNVLISRRNKSLTVSEVEKEVTDRIAEMRIEDDVNRMIANAVANLNLTDEINAVIEPKTFLLRNDLTVKIDAATGQLTNTENKLANLQLSMLSLSGQIYNLNNSVSNIQTENNQQENIINELKQSIALLNEKIGQLSTSTTSTSIGLVINQSDGTVETTPPQPSPSQGEGADTPLPTVDTSILTATSSSENQDGTASTSTVPDLFIPTSTPEFIDASASTDSTSSPPAIPSEIGSSTETVQPSNNIAIEPYSNSASIILEPSSVTIVEPIAPTASNTPQIIDPSVEGDIATFKKENIIVMTISSESKVSIYGDLKVAGNITICKDLACSEKMEFALAGDKGNLGVEGKVVAGAFEGYCPDGFVWAPGSAKYGTLPGFCVMAGEARHTNGHELGTNFNESRILLTDGLTGEAWTDITQAEAQIACQGLGVGYHLISENEWLTLAENIISNPLNDSDPNKIGLQLATTTQIQNSKTQITDKVATTSPEFEVSFTLTNKSIIQNLVGGVGEWTNKFIREKDMIEPLEPRWMEYYEVSSFKSMDNIIPPYYLDNATNGIGLVYTGAPESSSQRGFIRGENGLFGLNLSYSPQTATSTVGFRCAK